MTKLIKHKWFVPVVSNMIMVGVVATVWEFCGLYTGGVLRYLIASVLVGAVAYVIGHEK